MIGVKEAAAFIEVGQVRNDDEDVFIAVPPALYEAVKKPLSGKVMHSIRIPRRDLHWLIRALKEEKTPQSKKPE